MTNPRRTRLIAIVSTILGLVGIALANEYATETESWWSAAGIVGATVAFFGVCYIIYAQLEAVRYNRLMRGEDRLAEWLVDPHRWRDFLKLNDQLNTQPDGVYCDIRDRNRDRLREEGIKVVIGKAALMVDGEFHSLPVGGVASVYGPWLYDGPPPYLEFQRHMSDDTPRTWAIRIPVAAGADSDARMVCEYYHSGRPAPKVIQLPNIRNYRRGRNVALVIAALSAAVFAIAMMMRDQQEFQNLILVGAIIGALLCPGALIVALVCHLRLGRTAPGV
jgi:hypothetical protein